MEDVNLTTQIGRCVRDAELKFTAGGMAIVNFSIAVTKRQKKGEAWEDYTNFFDVTLFGKSGENLARYLVKGKQVGLSGELKQERWEKDGQHRSRVVILANYVQLLGGGEHSASVKGEAREQSSFQDDMPF